ncbi:SAF domain-containing protein [Desulfotomaculum copahuensis]|uniref:SAF domain-containing protein n=1 Tax=Desulfotomaculum copahuensis TaxID=1838280 RepID=A0A1B7LG82_9FIRM|nr:SAF domain-containing protein [Desulfotomaculum copahuensis]OAT83697.1 hypothetical protein A6M21_07625 [Desulfotomaculum copahuensis]
MFKNYRLMLIFALVFGALAVAGSIYTVQNKIGAVPVVVAYQNLDDQKVITPGDIRVEPIPRAALYPDALTSPNQAVGWVARGYIPAGTVLRASMLLPPDKAGLSGKLVRYPGQEGVALQAGLETDVAGSVRPGDMVEVTARYKDGQAERLFNAVPVLQASDKGLVLALTSDENIQYQKALSKGAAIVCALLPKK